MATNDDWSSAEEEGLANDLERLALEREAESAPAPTPAVATEVTDPFDRAVSHALPCFSTVRQIGLYVWRPLSPKRGDLKPFANATEEDFVSRIKIAPHEGDVPVVNLSGVALPVDFVRNPKPQFLPNRFPNDPGVGAALAAAAMRGLDWRTLDFVIGGSGLHVLSARSTSGNVYLVQKVQGALTLGKHAEYTSDLQARGFQFERLVTGERMDGRANEDCVASLQVAMVGPFKIYFHAELDAVDGEGAHVEIKSGNPHKFGSKEMFQMVASRSSKLIYAVCQGNRVVGIQEEGLEDVARRTSASKRADLEATLLENLRELKDLADEVSEDVPSQLTFENGRVKLTPRPDLSQLPSRAVLDALLARTLG